MPSLPSLTGQILDGRYCLTQFLGEGAFGVVYQAEHLLLDDVLETVAVKLISLPTDEAKRQVINEAKSMAAYTHPNLLSFRTAGIVDISPWTGDVYIVSELAETTLDSYVKAHGFLSPEETVVLARELAQGLAYLAEKRCIHRDLKPANVLRVGSTWKLADFGLARTLEGSASHLSVVGGTPLYMAPESWRGHVTPAVDVWAWAAIVQWCLTGELPYARRASQDEFIAHVVRQMPYVVPHLPAPLAEIVAACLQKDPTKRPTPQRLVEQLAGEVTPAVSVSTTLQEEGIRVASDGSGHFVTITEAIENAPAGSTIYVAPGVYHEKIVIDKPINLTGEATYNEKVVLEAGDGNALKVLGGSGRIQGLCVSGIAAKVGKRFFSSNILCGEWEFEGCKFSSDSLPAVRVAEEANVRFLNCDFCNGANDGLLVEGGHKAFLFGCRLNNNARYGLHIKTAPEEGAELEGCILETNQRHGAYVGAGTLRLKTCSLSDNGAAGLEVSNGEVDANSCKIVGNKAQGVIASSQSIGAIVACDLSNNLFGAWDIPRGCLLERRINKE